MIVHAEVTQYYSLEFGPKACQQIRFELHREHGDSFSNEQITDAFNEWLDSALSMALPQDEELTSVSPLKYLEGLIRSTPLITPEVPGQLQIGAS